ncbi:MAG: R3H domain-containing nucleic acid-binding protein [Rothia sp. (in: high G+C Gram-positive bacteria)]|uniref:Jag family protein n=1 Tax=Rothia sp. (in: high G+C Gram-positive bacteria) TaxID=1885016 RepID=UPI0026DF83D7|nr:R3H domain-containing nucleic acid-binding protein [Rothia sp. (in: high G+C Gram-positive bacteria)]MDO5749594.1 R3H domain-containing nucleic acid-binding protein [Rothia sp. (in: high G+C Gram-positive bacteria)]
MTEEVLDIAPEELESVDFAAEEGDIAADYLEELLDIADIDGDIDIEVRNQRTYLSVVNEEDEENELHHLVGRNGEVLEALQELVRLAVLAQAGERSRLILDVDGYRAARRQELTLIAQEAIERVRESGKEHHMKPLGAYERKVVHDVVAAAGLYSESEGEGTRRHIVISLPEA